MSKLDQTDYGKCALASLFAVHLSVDPETALDCIEETQSVIDDFLNGNTHGYETLEDILIEYMGMTQEWLWLFVTESHLSLLKRTAEHLVYRRGSRKDDTA